MREIEAFILVGGSSSRMGTDKALLELGGRKFVERIFAALAPISTQTSLVGDRVGIVGLPTFQMVPDVHVKWGALGGLHAALGSCRAQWAAVVACDLPFVTGDLFVRLASLRENFDAVVPVQTDGRLQPLCSLYRREVCLDQADQLIAAGERRPRALFDRVRARKVAFTELADLPGATRFFVNVNTPEEYNDALGKEKNGW